MADTSAAPMADRISDLPEAVLHHILSLLPAQDAVRTCVLALSRRDRWRSTPAVRFVGSTTGLVGVRAFAAFVDGLLRARRGAPRLDSCEFDLDVVDLIPCYLLFDLRLHGDSWIRRVLELNVRELRFRVSSNLADDPLELDYLPLTSQHLTRLELTDVEGVDLDFSGCPALRSLKMEASNVSSMEMRSSSLKHLSIKSCCFYVQYRTRMSFPSLISFEFIKIPEQLRSLKECRAWKLQKFDSIMIVITRIVVEMVDWKIVEMITVGVVLITMVLLIPAGAACFFKAWLNLRT